MNKEEVVERFEDIVNELKEPILKSTSVGVEHANNDSQQDLGEAVEGIERLLDELYASIKKMIHRHSGEGGTADGKAKLDEHALEQIFERKNIISALKKNPGELKEPLLEKLHLLLKEYPFSPRVDFVHRLKEAGMQPPSKVIKIIPNTV